MSSKSSADRASLIRRFVALLALLHELRTPAVRRLAQARVRSVFRSRIAHGSATSRRSRHGSSRLGDGRQPSDSGERGGGWRGGSGLEEAAARIAWRPRDLAERVARRARRERAAGRRQGSSSAGGQMVRQRYGDSYYSAIGARGGSTVLEERGVKYLQDIGARGGAVTRQRYGPEHYAEIGRKGGLAGRGRKRSRQQPNQPELPL